MMRFLDGVERYGNRLPHPFWLFCILILIVCLASATLAHFGVTVDRPATHVLRTVGPGGGTDGRAFTAAAEPDALVLKIRSANLSSRLTNLHLELYHGGQLIYDEPIAPEKLRELRVSTKTFPVLQAGDEYVIKIVNRAESIPIRSLPTKAGLEWFVLHMVENFAHFEPLGLVLVMLMGVAIAEGAGLVPTVMRGVALSVPGWLIIPVLFALAACGNVGSDAGIVVIPPLAAAIFKQMGKSPIAGLLVGYVGATAGFTANFFPAGTDVLAMSLTNAATGGTPEVNVFSNWYFMALSVPFLAILGTFVTRRYLMPRLGDAGDAATAQIDPLTGREKRASLVALLAILAAMALWAITIIPENGWLRNPDPDPELIWRSPFFRGLIPVLFTLFAAGGIAYGLVAGTVKKADDILGFMTETMKRMGPYIVLTLAIAQFTEMFQWSRMDQLIAVEGAAFLRAVGMEAFPIPFFISFILVIAVANLFMGSASAKWAIFAPIFVPMFMALGFHPAFTQLLYRLGDSITNCVSPLYPYFPILLGWIAEIDREKAKVGTVLSYLVPYANFLLLGWLVMMVIWYLLGLPVGPDSPLLLAEQG
jgi:aminobenzoyl-glutamate transport protein